MIAPVVAATSHTLVRRPPGDLLVRFVLDLLRLPHHRTVSSPSPWARHTGLPGGLGQGTESLTGVLQAQCATRQGQGPGARLTRRPQRPETHRRRRATRPDFHACAASPHGTSGLTGKPTTLCQCSGGRLVLLRLAVEVDAHSRLARGGAGSGGHELHDWRYRGDHVAPG